LTKSLTKLSVIENMKLGATHQMGEKWWNGLLPFRYRKQEAIIERRADELLKRFKLDHMRDQYAGTLSGGQRKLLEMARALMTDPRLVMLDEPMAGVNPALKQSLNEHIRGLRDDGMTVLFVEHDMDMVHDISDWVVVMAEGRIIADEEIKQQIVTAEPYSQWLQDNLVSLDQLPGIQRAFQDDQPHLQIVVQTYPQQYKLHSREISVVTAPPMIQTILHPKQADMICTLGKYRFFNSKNEVIESGITYMTDLTEYSTTTKNLNDMIL
jgi:ABC-type multidrug transport system ATPase subunit